MRSSLRVAFLAAGVWVTAAFAGSTQAQTAADPPAELGQPYAIDGATVIPTDGPFDDVGLAVLDAEGIVVSSISLAHRTLPLPSYAEVTALDSGRTILARVERRGPLSGPAFVALSSGAFAQMGADPSVPLGVRVRRVSPQEYERSLLRTGQRAPERLATPKPLLEVLRRRLANKAVPVAVAPSPASISAEADVSPPAGVEPKAPPVAKPAIAKSFGSYVVQVAAFANRVGADTTARKLDAIVSSAGKLWRVRMGPFASRTEADSALSKARKAGFADAQIVTAQK